MKFFVSILAGLLFTLTTAACNHVTPKPDAVNSAPVPSQVYGFKVVEKDVPQQRAVNSKSKTPSVRKEKFVVISECVNPENCANPAKEAVVPYDRFIAQVQQEVKANEKIVENHEQFLEKSLNVLKSEQEVMEQEQAYYERQLKLYRWSSLKPVVDGHKKAQEVVAHDLSLFKARILRIEDELRFVRRKNGPRLSQEDSVIMLMEMAAAGFPQYKPEFHSQDNVWKMFEKMGKQFTSTPGV
ncbi:MAG: hypothetical protein K2Q26_10480 [Bdellovibrionales bacterium]|nr:hypothetical protein [Bdellovibrionales bacterium]